MAKALSPDLLPTLEALSKTLRYDPETGQWSRKTKKHGWILTGRLNSSNDRWQVSVSCKDKSRLVSATRLAWLFMTGRYPGEKDVIDHVNRKTSDDRWANLRMSTQSANMRNISRKSLAGTYHDVRAAGRRKFRAILRNEGTVYDLGRYETQLEAHRAYIRKLFEIAPDSFDFIPQERLAPEFRKQSDDMEESDDTEGAA